MKKNTECEIEPQEMQTEHHCILCEAIIEIGDHEFYFATGYCRYCHQAAEDPADK